MSAIVYAALPVVPLEHAMPCGNCGGLGVTGDCYEQPGELLTLVVDVICPDCAGCGNADPGHLGCPPDAHAELDEDWGEHEDDGEPGYESPCPSCISGRGWNAVQAFGADEAVTLRVPCGCSESRLVRAGSTDELAALLAKAGQS